MTSLQDARRMSAGCPQDVRRMMHPQDARRMFAGCPQDDPLEDSRTQDAMPKTDREKYGYLDGARIVRVVLGRASPATRE